MQNRNAEIVDGYSGMICNAKSYENIMLVADILIENPIISL